LDGYGAAVWRRPFLVFTKYFHNPTSPAAETIAISRAECDRSKITLGLEATSTRSTATLQAFVNSTRQLIGTLHNDGGGKSAVSSPGQQIRKT